MDYLHIFRETLLQGCWQTQVPFHACILLSLYRRPLNFGRQYSHLEGPNNFHEVSADGHR